MPRPENTRQLILRLRTVEGHIKGIIKMLEADTSAADVLKQIGAVRSSLGVVNALVYNTEVNEFAQRMRNNASQQERLRNANELLELFHLQSH